MAVYAIGDLHLSLGCDKPMDVFSGWHGYMEKLEQNWRRLISEDDTTVIAGDFSWGMTLAEAREDFLFLESLPGKKLLVKGNHDYWWCTQTKLDKFFAENGLTTMDILHNKSVLCGTAALCGTRGWTLSDGGEEDAKIAEREAMRLEASLAYSDKFGEDCQRVVFLHYPPVCVSARSERMLDIMREHGVRRCYYGHLHGAARRLAVEGEVSGIAFRLISADNVSFCPVLVAE